MESIVARIAELKRKYSAITWEQIQTIIEAETDMRWPSPMALRAWWRRRKHVIASPAQSLHAQPLHAQSLHSEPLRSEQVRGEQVRNEQERPLPASVRSTVEQLFARETVRDATREAVREAAREAVRETMMEDYAIPEPLPKPFHEPMRIPFQRTLVLADIHAPFHDKSFLQQLLNKHHREYDQIVVAGDLFDFAQISRHPRDWNVPRLETELAMAGEVLLALAKVAPVLICNGNHDERMAVKLDAALSLQRLIYAALGNKQPRYTITVSEYDYIEIGDTFIVGHLSQFHKQGGKLAAQIAKQRQRHVLVGHDHLLGVVQNDQWLGASIGCIADPKKFWYSERRLNTFTPMQQGYAILRNEDEFEVFNRFSEPIFRRYRYLGNMYNSWRAS